MLVDSQAIMMPGVDLAGGSVPAVPPQWPPCKGPSLAPRPQRAGRGAARPLALRPRPGEPSPPLLADRDQPYQGTTRSTE